MPTMHTQSLADFNAPRTDKRMTRSRLRRALYRLGYQGTALHSELERITAGPVPLAADGSNLKEAMDAIQARLGDELAAKYPYGWLKSEMTRPMRRIFHGKAKLDYRHIAVDEFWRVAK